MQFYFQEDEKLALKYQDSESVEFSGMAVRHMAQDATIMKKTGQAYYTCDLAKEYKFTDLDGGIHDIRYTRTGVLG